MIIALLLFAACVNAYEFSPGLKAAVSASDFLLGLKDGTRHIDRIDPSDVSQPSERRSAPEVQERFYSKHYKDVMQTMTVDHIDAFVDSQKRNSRRTVGEPNTFDTIVVGTGAGGLATGAALMSYAPIFAPQGHSLLMIEQNLEAGGAMDPFDETFPYLNDDGEWVNLDATFTRGFQGSVDLPGLSTIYDEVLLAPPGTYDVSHSNDGIGRSFRNANGEVFFETHHFLNTTGTSSVGEAIAQSVEIAFGLFANDLVNLVLSRGEYDQIDNMITYVNDVATDLVLGIMGLPPIFSLQYARTYFETRFAANPIPEDIKEILMDMSTDDGPNAYLGPFMFNQELMTLIWLIGGLVDLKGSSRKPHDDMLQRITDYGGVFKTGHKLTEVLFEDPSDPTKATGVVIQRVTGVGDGHAIGLDEVYHANNVVLAIHTTDFFQEGMVPQHVIDAAGLTDYMANFPGWSMTTATVDVAFSESAEALGFSPHYVKMMPTPIVTFEHVMATDRPSLEECTQDKFTTTTMVANSMLQTEVVGDEAVSYITTYTPLPFNWFREFYNDGKVKNKHQLAEWMDECYTRIVFERLEANFPGALAYQTKKSMITPINLAIDFRFAEGAFGQAPPEYRIWNPATECADLPNTSGFYLVGGAKDIGCFLGGKHGLETMLQIYGVDPNLTCALV